MSRKNHKNRAKKQGEEHWSEGGKRLEAGFCKIFPKPLDRRPKGDYNYIRRTNVRFCKKSKAPPGCVGGGLRFAKPTEVRKKQHNEVIACCLANGSVWLRRCLRIHRYCSVTMGDSLWKTAGIATACGWCLPGCGRGIPAGVPAFWWSWGSLFEAGVFFCAFLRFFTLLRFVHIFMHDGY